MPAQSHRALTLAALLSSMFMAAMEATVVATAMPSVVADLKGIEHYGWVGAAYLLSSTVTMPLFGKLADQRGRKPVMLWGISLFLLGSMASGAAQDMLQLIVARALQGVGAGAIQPISMTLVGDLYRPEQRAKVQGLFGAIWAVAGISGPLLGGFLVDALSWRWVFYVNVPFGFIAATLLVTSFAERRQGTEHRLDVLGVLALSTGVVCLLLGASGSHPVVTLPAALVTLGAFIVIEQRAAEPLLSLPLLKTRLMATSNAMCILLGAVMMGVLNYVPLHVQAIWGGTPTQAGTSIAPMMLSWPLASVVSGRLLIRFGYRPMVRLGGLLIAAATTLLLVPVAAEFGPWLMRLCCFALGLGLGFANTALIIAVQDSVQWRQRGVATAVLLFSRSIGGAVSVGGLGALLSASIGQTEGRQMLDELLRPGPKTIGSASLGAVHDALAGGLVDVFRTLVALAALAWLATLSFPRTTQSAPSTPSGPAQ